MFGRMIALCCLLVACQSSAPAPLDPVWGKQACAHCMMLLSEPGPAAQLLRSDGARLFFDDIGCMAEWLARNGERPEAAWVRNIHNSGWADAFATRYSAGHRTPMDYGFLPARDGQSFAELSRSVQQQTKRRLEAR